MAKTATLSIRIDPKTKRDAEKLFSQLGISMTSAINMFFHQAIAEKSLPFRPSVPEIPNAETIAAMEEVEQMIADKKAGKPIEEFNSAEEFYKAMGI